MFSSIQMHFQLKRNTKYLLHCSPVRSENKDGEISKTFVRRLPERAVHPIIFETQKSPGIASLMNINLRCLALQFYTLSSFVVASILVYAKQKLIPTLYYFLIMLIKSILPY